VSQKHDPTIDLEPAPAASLASIQRLAKLPAVSSFEKRLVAEQIPQRMAAAIARAVVDPADARRRLERLTQIRVPGGVVMALESTIWATTAVPYVVNNREARDRHFPAGVKLGSVEAARYRPLRPPTDATDGSAQLEINAEGPQHLVWSLERSAKFLLENNDLTESIGVQGVMQYVTLAAIDITFNDGKDPVIVLGSIDGSSRINSAHAVLGVTPNDVVYAYPGNERGHRQYIATLLENLERPVTAVAAEDVTRLRALQIPARIFVKFEPDPTGPISFSKAVASFVHLIHVEPPKPWDDAASLDAKADSVLTELLKQGQITPKRKTYMEGMFTPAEATAKSLPRHLDERALEIVAVISSEQASMYRAVREGVLLLSKRGGQVRRELKTEIAVELALRGVRSNLTVADANGARESLQNAFLHSEIWSNDLKSAGESPHDLRDAALKELEDGGAGSACRRIAAQGVFWLAVQRILREARFFDSDKNLRDGRTPQRVLTDLMRNPWGIHVLHRAIVDGRDGVPIVQVDQQGTRQKGVNGKILEASHAWLRSQVVPQQIPGQSGSGDTGNGGPALPDRLLLIQLTAFKKAVDHLEDAHAQLRSVKDASGKVLVDVDGLAEETVEDLRKRLEDLRTSLAIYGQTWKLKNVDSSEDQAEGDVSDATEATEASS
jgi:hypothetical protein